MLIGIIIQMIAITFYVILAGEFFIRFQLNKPVRMESYVHLDIEKKMLGKKMKSLIPNLKLSGVDKSKSYEKFYLGLRTMFFRELLFTP